eukprot:2152709-Pyramimonas_sp.AAC.1
MHQLQHGLSEQGGGGEASCTVMACWEMYQAQHGVPVHAPPTYYARVRAVPVLVRDLREPP